MTSIKNKKNIIFDFIFCLGGDGTILHMLKTLGTKSFKSKVFAINFGKVGFIAPF